MTARHMKKITVIALFILSTGGMARIEGAEISGVVSNWNGEAVF